MTLTLTGLADDHDVTDTVMQVPGCHKETKYVKGRKKLFISYKPSKSDEIKRATISSWICKLIHLAYESEGSDPRALVCLAANLARSMDLRDRSIVLRER